MAHIYPHTSPRIVPAIPTSPDCLLGARKLYQLASRIDQRVLGGSGGLSK